MQPSSSLAHIAILKKRIRTNARCVLITKPIYMAEMLFDGGVVGFSYNALANSYS